MKLKLIYLLIIILTLVNTKSVFSQDKQVNPIVFLVGENDEQFSSITKNYSESLLSVSHDSMEIAYLNWMYLLKDIEDFAKLNKFDLNGIKLWLNVFWDEGGNIDLISYYPKPNSKNMDFSKLTEFLKSFAKQYKPRLKYNYNFSHYGSARFPSFADMYINAK